VECTYFCLQVCAEFARVSNVQADSLYVELDRQLTKLEQFFKERKEADIRKEVDMFQMVGYFLLNTFCLIMMAICLFPAGIFLRLVLCNNLICSYMHNDSSTVTCTQRPLSSGIYHHHI